MVRSKILLVQSKYCEYNPKLNLILYTHQARWLNWQLNCFQILDSIYKMSTLKFLFWLPCERLLNKSPMAPRLSKPYCQPPTSLSDVIWTLDFKGGVCNALTAFHLKTTSASLRDSPECCGRACKNWREAFYIFVREIYAVCMGA